MSNWDGSPSTPQPELEHPLDRHAARLRPTVAVEERPGHAPDEVRVEPLVAGRDRRVDREHAVAADRRARRRRGTAGRDQLARPLRQQERRVALVEVPDGRVSSSSRSARTPPTPSTSSWCSRISRPRTYRMCVIGRSESSLSGTSVSSSSTGTRPTCATQTAAYRSRPGSGTLTVSGSPERVERPQDRQARQLVVRVGVLLVPVGVDRLAEVALAVQEPDPDQRQRHVAGRLHVIAGQHAQAARVDAQRLVEAVLGAEVGDRPLELVGRAGAGTSGPRRWPCTTSNSARMSWYSAMNAVFSSSCVQSTAPGQDGDGVAVARPAAGVDPAEQDPGPRVPAPPQVVGEAAQAFELGRQVEEAPGATGRERGAPCAAMIGGAMSP